MWLLPVSCESLFIFSKHFEISITNKIQNYLKNSFFFVMERLNNIIFMYDIRRYKQFKIFVQS